MNYIYTKPDLSSMTFWVIRRSTGSGSEEPQPAP